MSSRMASLFRLVALALALFASGAFVVTEADARAGRGFSFGSRGGKTYSAPPATSTAPRAAPVEKSITQPGRSATAAPAATPSRFGGFGALLMGGLIGAGLASLFGLGGMANVLGFLLQMLLIGGLVYLVVMFFRNRSSSGQPAMATASPEAARRLQTVTERTAANSYGGGGAPALNIVGADYDTFERLLKEVQNAYARGDRKALADRTTPEMLAGFAHELQENAQRGVSNDLSEPKLLKGDLAEAWREQGAEYATVAMRYEIIDATVETSSGRVVAGSTTKPEVVTEVWTFTRPTNGRADQWELSAIQQAA